MQTRLQACTEHLRIRNNRLTEAEQLASWIAVTVEGVIDTFNASVDVSPALPPVVQVCLGLATFVSSTCGPLISQQVH
jgi:hypothetical protein